MKIAVSSCLLAFSLISSQVEAQALLRAGCNYLGTYGTSPTVGSFEFEQYEAAEGDPANATLVKSLWGNLD